MTENDRELQTLRDLAKEYDVNFPCDGGCNTNDGPSEECSRHGRSPRDLWNLLDEARRDAKQGEPSDAQVVEFPFTHDGVTLEQDDGGLWITIDGYGAPRWLGPKALAALRAAGGVR